MSWAILKLYVLCMKLITYTHLIRIKQIILWVIVVALLSKLVLHHTHLIRIRRIILWVIVIVSPQLWQQIDSRQQRVWSQHLKLSWYILLFLKYIFHTKPSFKSKSQEPNEHSMEKLIREYTIWLRSLNSISWKFNGKSQGLDFSKLMQ